MTLSFQNIRPQPAADRPGIEARETALDMGPGTAAAKARQPGLKPGKNQFYSPRKTKIVATIGPASNSKPVLKKMIAAGLNVARLNLSHGTYKEHQQVIDRIRSLAGDMNTPVAILLDLQGPKIRTGKLRSGKPVVLRRNGSIRITTRQVAGTRDLVSTTYADLVEDVKTNETLLLADGHIKLKVLSKSHDTLDCKIIHGGTLGENTGINLPGCRVSAPCLTTKDQQDIEFGIDQGVDYLALSFVRTAADLTRLKAILKKKRADIPVIAKIEKREAVDNFDAILEVADGIMVARGDLGTELRLERVPTVQKHIIDRAVRANKPVITATQMLETMCDSPVPTRAEISDVANAIFDGTDAVMLSGETATGKYPVEAVKMMARIATEAEGSIFMRYNIEHGRSNEELVAHAAAQSAVNVLHEVDAKAIISFSVSGKTSKLLSKQRPCKPVFAFTPYIQVYNRMALMWGIIPLCIPVYDDTKRLIAASEKLLLQKKLIRKKDIVVIIIGLAFKSGSTNLIKIHRVGEQD